MEKLKTNQGIQKRGGHDDPHSRLVKRCGLGYQKKWEYGGEIMKKKKEEGKKKVSYSEFQWERQSR